MRRQYGLIFSAGCVMAFTMALVLPIRWSEAASQEERAQSFSSRREGHVPIEPGQTVYLKGNAGGSVRATQYGVSRSGPCMGWIPKEAQHQIVLTTKAKTRISVHSTADTTLILVGEPDGKPLVRCSDDVDGNDPVLHESLPPGQYRLYVGTWNAGSRVPFTMRISSAAE